MNRKAQQKAAYQRRKADSRARDKHWAINHLIDMAEGQATRRDQIQQIENLQRIMGRPPSTHHEEFVAEMAEFRSWLAAHGGSTFAFTIPPNDPDIGRFRDVLMDADWEQVSQSFEGPDGPDRMVAYRFTDEWAVLIRLTFSRYIEPA